MKLDNDLYNSIYREAFTLSLNKPFDKNLSSSCLVFLEVLGYDTRIFKVYFKKLKFNYSLTFENKNK